MYPGKPASPRLFFACSGSRLTASDYTLIDKSGYMRASATATHGDDRSAADEMTEGRVLLLVRVRGDNADENASDVPIGLVAVVPPGRLPPARDPAETRS